METKTHRIYYNEVYASYIIVFVMSRKNSLGGQEVQLKHF